MSLSVTGMSLIIDQVFSHLVYLLDQVVNCLEKQSVVSFGVGDVERNWQLVSLVGDSHGGGLEWMSHRRCWRKG